MNRRMFLWSSFGCSAAAVPYPFWMEPRWFEVTDRRVIWKHAPFAKPLRVLHLSDLHASKVVPVSMIEEAIKLGLAQAPDVICLTGDFITDRKVAFDPDEYVAVLRQLSAAAPTFAVLGNHDGGVWARTRSGYGDHQVVARILKRSGIELLHNRSARVEAGGARVTLVGCGDLWSEAFRPDLAFSNVNGRGPVVLLAHNPDSKDEAGAYPWDVMLSGHTHGGQVVLPFLGTRFAPVEDKRYVEGLKPWGEKQIHVTRGVGNIAGIRFGCRPEVSLLRMG